ncbi:MAG: DUF4097 family beta strand repeat protein [Acidimicrobiia bacterium]|nr:DUF4097 family beta strand repeat protein [Acidimicrobiia bacterium]
MSPISEHFALAGEHANLTISIPAGTVRIAESTDASVSITVEGKDLDNVEITGVGDDITISMRTEKEGGFRLFGGSSRLAVLVLAPAGSHANIATGAADFFSEIELGSLRFKTGAGDAKITSVRGDVDAKSASGDLHAHAVMGSLKASLASGDVNLHSVDGSVDVNTASGDLHVMHVHGDVNVKSASGDLVIDRWDGTGFAGKTVAGDVRLGVPKGTRADMNVRSLSGDIHMPSSGSSDVPEEDRVMRRIGFNSVSGDLHLTVVD